MVCSCRTLPVDFQSKRTILHLQIAVVNEQAPLCYFYLGPLVFVPTSEPEGNLCHKWNIHWFQRERYMRC